MVSRRSWPSMMLSERRRMRRPSGATSRSGFSATTVRSSSMAKCTLSCVSAPTLAISGAPMRRANTSVPPAGPLRSLRSTVCAAMTCGTPLMHQSQRAFLVEHGAHDRRQPVDLGDDHFARGMTILRIVGVVLERGQQFLFRVEQPDQVDVHFVEAGFGESSDIRSSESSVTRRSTCRPSARSRARRFRFRCSS